MSNRSKKNRRDREALNKALAILNAGMAKARREVKRISLADLKAAAIKRRSGRA